MQLTWLQSLAPSTVPPQTLPRVILEHSWMWTQTKQANMQNPCISIHWYGSQGVVLKSLLCAEG